MRRLVFRIADAADVAHPGDYNRLRLGLARMEWVKALPGAARYRTVDALAAALLFPVAQARLGAPPIPPRAWREVSRKRKPGGGRRPDVTRQVLASDVERALRGAGVRAGRWRIDRRSSPLLEVLTLCWEVVTGAPGKPGVIVRDMRRITAKRHYWPLLPSRPMTAADQRWLWGLIS